MSELNLIKLNDLSVSFRSERGLQKAVEHVSFDLIAGRTLAVVGESGSGKSVSSLSLMQLLQKDRAVFDSGRIEISSQLLGPDEKSSSKTFYPDDPMIKSLRGKKIAMIFQEPMTALNPVITCGEQISEMLRRHEGLDREEARNRVIALFREVSLPRPEEMFDQYPHQLSGGQRQRVMIAMAISCRPAVLIADEPTTALDVTVQKSILNLLRDLQLKYRMAMLFITHDLGVVADIADDIVVMRGGSIVESGHAKDVLQNPAHPYTKGLLACRPVPGHKAERLLTVADFMDTSGEIRESANPIIKREEKKECLLEVKSLYKTYHSPGSLFKKSSPPVNAVNDVSFEIMKGETLGLVGESGCGKTTLSRMLLGLIPSTSGDIVFSFDHKSYNIPSLSASELRALRKDIQIIFQDPYSSLNPKQTIGHAIMEPMEVFGLFSNNNQRRERVASLLEQVGMKPEFMSRYPHEFSGGQRQRIVIARALAVEPKFIICDESVSALDVSVQAQVLNLLNDLKNEYGLTYLFISHDLGVVYHMSDRIMVMNKGKIEEIGTADEVYHHPQSAYTAKLIASIPGSKGN